ncbi:DNA-binding HxlR family transcriptional regulator [Clostridium saccharoperbutylacetonicum]|uniref:Transcriptional regulator, HxlR family n=1 Tax=Clostridium saccharoperbutylacetonicum N1-4(HMT) TaxID=931276 RepID=M1MHN3_9CLOT|nr:helix-turn-helix domain-containing protein [Clostridium saccharoperbutylacetonicum]AGF55813.1 transcriptional regulator, HxlR family [Clostridium saccharoperbutylacetonicum N1-4(HMT)]NRT63452.1 DNA-binding HxlR family transcriptional regulator [Clostridium saccharoperbutylacetonicum]NSB26814.1 DNA-binding HxlR family transcriptional regulator [Clostridium saccharoperbutylacetonicum]NSB40294.1 DNA-binding HxlR family transcriptional regulator [Clostridium saccharoperbutylacetonicum]
MKNELNANQPNYHETCPIIDALEVIGGKWKIPIMSVIYNKKSIRYNELKRNIPGITNIMLTRSLRSLEEQGLVKRLEYSSIPPHVEYSLTDICEELVPALEILNEWGKKLSRQ